MIKPDGEFYETTDQMMCEALMMAGFTAVSVTPTGYGPLAYIFSLEEVWPTVELILTGGASKLTFRLSEWWKARITWQMNLRHYAQNKRTGEHNER